MTNQIRQGESNILRQKNVFKLGFCASNDIIIIAKSNSFQPRSGTSRATTKAHRLNNVQATATDVCIFAKYLQSSTQLLFKVSSISTKLQLIYPFRIKFMKIAARAHMNDLSIIILVLS